MYRYFQREADITIVTNPELEQRVSSNGGRPFVLPDKIPTPPQVGKTTLRGRHNVAYICTFSADEPYRQVIEAARHLPEDVVIHITGNSGKLAPQVKQQAPANVVFTGFISEPDYWRLLCSVDLVMALTTRQDCLLCGAYEAVAAGKPLIVTGTKVLKGYFHKGCVHTPDNDQRSIAGAILNALENYSTLSDSMSSLKSELTSSWLLKANTLQRLLN